MKPHTSARRLLAAGLVVALGAGAVVLLRSCNPTATSDRAGAGTGQSAHKILYYRHPMGLADTSPVPKKDAMGMDYIPVREGDDVANGTTAVALDEGRLQKAGVRLAPVSSGVLRRTVQLLGRVEADERLQTVVAPRFEGWIEKVQVASTGQFVRRGQVLFEAFSPDLIAAQKEYQVAISYANQRAEDVELGLFSLMPQTDIALQGAIKEYESGKANFGSVTEAHWQIRKALDEYYKRIRLPKGSQSVVDNVVESHTNMRRLTDAALNRLKNLEVPDSRIKSLQGKHEPPRLMPYLSPATGVVTEKKAIQGMRFGSGDVLYQITDISSVWVMAEAFEQDVAALRLGQEVKVRTDAYPDKVLHGRVGYIYPTVNTQTRAVPVRIELANADGLLRPGMFARVDWAVQAGKPDEKILTVPTSAVLDSGQAQRVFVQTAPGRFEARQVRLGLRGDEQVQVLSGLREGEQVVVSGDFLIDSESNLKSALKGFASGGSTAPSGAVSHHASGVVQSVDVARGEAVITHEPVASLNWPQMTMVFVPVREELFAGLKPGTPVDFEFLERKPGEWVITRLNVKGK